MPVIPTLQESAVLDSSKHPIAAVDPSEAGIQDRAMQKLGQGLTELGAGYTEYANKRREVAKKIDIDNFKADAMAKALELHAGAIRNAEADGSNVVKLFSEEYDNWYKERLSQVQDPDAMREARAAAVTVRNTMNTDLYEKSQAMFTEFGVTNSRRLRSQATAGVFNNPDEWEAYSQRGYSTFKAITPLLSKLDLRKELLTYESDFADNHINGLVNQKRYDDARKALATQWAGQFQGEARQKKMDYIDQQQFQNIDRSRSTIRFEQEQAKIKLEETQKSNFRSLWEKQLSGTNIDEEAERLEGLGMITNAQRAIITTKQEKFDTKVSQYSRNNFYGRALIMGEDVRLLMPEVAKSVQAGKMTPTDGYETVNFLFQLDEKRKNKKYDDPAFKALEASYKRRIGAHFGVDTDNPLAWSLNKGPQAEMAATALHEFTRHVYMNGYDTPERMGDAYKMVMKDKGGFVLTTSDVPSIPGLTRDAYEDPKAVESAYQRLKQRHQKGELNDSQYLKELEKFKALRKVNDEKAKAKGATSWVDYNSGGM